LGATLAGFADTEEKERHIFGVKKRGVSATRRPSIEFDREILQNWDEWYEDGESACEW